MYTLLVRSKKAEDYKAIVLVRKFSGLHKDWEEKGWSDGRREKKTESGKK
jgi:hypothetical protein